VLRLSLLFSLNFVVHAFFFGFHFAFSLFVSHQTFVRKLLQEIEARNSGLELQMQLREDEIRSYENQIAELSSNVLRLEDQANALATDKCHLENDLEAVRELCNKLDKQKEKLEAELAEHSSIRQQLDRENEKLRQELSTVQSGDTAAVSGLQDLLAASREEIEQHRMTAHQLNQEVLKLREKAEDLQDKVISEQVKAEKSEALAHEYNVQLQELRRLLTDDRFSQVRLREEASRYPTF
jgi:centrosomal protein CEP135